MLRIGRILKYLMVVIGLMTIYAIIYLTKSNSKHNNNNNVHIINNDLPLTINLNDVHTKSEAIVTERSESSYLLRIDANRLNRLFDIIYDKENKNSFVFEQLDLIQFDNLIKATIPKSNGDKNNVYQQFKNEIENYLKIENNRVRVTEKFIKYLKLLSLNNTFSNQRKKIREKRLTEQSNLVIVTAANAAYVRQLEATLFYVHRYFPNTKLLVYDLGLNQHFDKVSKNCKCELKPLSRVIDNVSVIFELKKYAWKPIIIQDALKHYEQIIYIDASIEFKTNAIEPILAATRSLGLLTQFIGLELVCYTHPKMFEWFGESTDTFNRVYTIEANILIFHRNFINSLIMKAWITCALDPDCIAPEGAYLRPCCGCHRYDQDAITIVSTYFYDLPLPDLSLPAFSLTKEESYFFYVARGHQIDHFKN